MTKKFPDIQNPENPNLYLTKDGIRAGTGHFFSGLGRDWAGSFWPGSGWPYLHLGHQF